MKKKNTIPSGFDDILGNIYSNAEEGGGITIIEDQPNTPLVEEIKDDDEPPVKTPEDGNNSGSDDPNAHEDNTEPPVQITDPEPPAEPPVVDPDNNGNQEPTDADVIEAQ